MTPYDPAVVQEFADRLYAKAKSIVISYAFLGGILGLVAGFAAATYLHENTVVFCVIGLFVFGAAGLSRGREKAFDLRLSAQTALCQVQIEKNSRKEQP
jgi:uncharacterized membrane protein YiaA